MADRRRKKNDIEEAKKAGQKALEDAKAGRTPRVESENEVRGFAEIPYLQGGNSNFGDTAPSVAIDTPTLPTVQQMSELSRLLQEQNASRNAQRRAERDSMPTQSQSESVPMDTSMAGYGPNVQGGTLDRRGTLSENGQKEVNKLNKRIESLRKTPMTGDAAIDEVTQSNNQSAIADLQRQIDSIYETDNSERSANVDRYLDSNRKLSKYEKNEANAIFEEYLDNNPKAKELYNTNDAAMSSLLAQRFKPDEAEEYAKMITLKNKISRGQSAGLHATESMPFVKGLADKSTEKYGERIGRDLSDYDYSSQLEQTQTQNPLASMGGNMAYQLGSYAAFAPLLEGIPVVGKAAEKVGGLFSNPAVGEAAANIVRGQAADTILDTLPNEVLPDIMEGNWRDLPKDILLNQAGNLAFNLGGEAVGALANRVIPYLRNVDEVADAVKQNEIDPATLAKQNEIDVNAKVDNVNQAVDEIKRLDEQIPDVPEEVNPDDAFIKNADDYMAELKQAFDTADPATKAEMLVDGGYYDDMIEAGKAYQNGELDGAVEDFLAKMERNGDPTPAKRVVDSNTYDHQALKEQYGGDWEAMRRGTIKEYTGVDDAKADEYYDALRRFVGGGYPGKNDTAILDDYVSKAPTYQGQITRGMHFNPEDGSYDEFMKQVHDSGTVTLGKPSSWATNPDSARVYSHMGDDGVDSIEIVCNKNRTSSPIDFINGQGEDEVISSSNASWTVLNEETYTRPNGSRKTIIRVAETGDKTPPKDAVVMPDQNVVDLLDFDEITPDLPSMPTQDLDAIKRVESTDGGDIVPPNGGRDVPTTTPEQPSGDKLSRYATNTMRRGTNLTPEEYAEQDLSQFMYESKTEKQSMEDAFRMIEEEGADNLKARLMAEEAKDLTQSETDALMSLIRTNNATIRALRFEGKLDEAAALRAETTAMNKKVRQQASSNAQGLQALAKWTRNTPEGMLMHAENIVNGNVKVEKSALQEALDKLKRSRKDVEFSPEFEDKFLEEAEKLMEIGDMDSREAKDIMARLGRLVNDQIPVKLNEKVQAFLMDNMLGNFRTLITRNAGGNIGLNAMEQTMTRPLAAGIDRLVARKTGRRTQAGMTKEALSDYIQGFKKGLSDEAHDLKTGLHTARTGENTLEEAIRSNRHVFKNRVQDKLDSLVKNGLSVGDRPFYEATYKQTIGDYYRLREQGVMGDAIQNLSDEAFEQYADVAANLNALAAVYQNNSKMAEALMGLKNGIGDLSEGMVGFDILSQFSMPFVKTPANVVDRAIDYSPLGIIRNIARTAKEGGIGGENFDQNRFVNETARNIIGTGLMGGGAAAAKAGGLSGSYSDDLDEKRVQKESGMQEYALNLPNDMQMDVGWIPVLGSNAVAAAAAYDAYRKNKGDGVGSAIAKGLAEGGQALFDQSMFQGLQRLFGTGESYNSEGTLPENLMNVVKQGLGQAIPSLVRQGAQVSDQYQRDLSGSNKDWSLGPIDNYTINSWANNIPFVRKAVLNPKVDSEGNFIEESQGRGLGSRILEDMFLPGKLTQVDYTRLNEEAQRLSDITGNTTSFMPRASRSKLDTDEHTLTNEEWLNFQQKYYSDMDTAGNALMDSQAYRDADDATKEEMMTDLFKAVSDATNATVTGKDISGAAKEFRDNNVEGLLKYVEAKNNPYKIEREAYQKMVDAGTDMSAYEGYGDALTANGVEDKAAYRNAYASGVTPEEKAANLQDEVQYQAALKEYELSDSDAVRAAWDKALHASSDPNYALLQLAQSRENAKDLGFVNSDGGINSAAYDKAMSVIGDDPNTLSSYASFKTSMSGLGTARETYLPKLEAMSGLSNAQKGQFAYLYGGAPKAGSSADQVLNSDYGYEGYYDYLMIQNSPDLNNNGKAHDKGDRIKYMYDVLGWDDSDDIYKYFVGLNY